MERIRIIWDKLKPSNTIAHSLAALRTMDAQALRDEKRIEAQLYSLQLQLESHIATDPRVKAIRHELSRWSDSMKAMQKLNRMWLETNPRHIETDKRIDGMNHRYHAIYSRDKMKITDHMSNIKTRFQAEEINALDVDTYVNDSLDKAVLLGIEFIFNQELRTYTTTSADPYWGIDDKRSPQGSFTFRVSWVDGKINYSLTQLGYTGTVIRSISSPDKTSVAIPIANAIHNRNVDLLFESPTDREKRKRFDQHVLIITIPR